MTILRGLSDDWIRRATQCKTKRIRAGMRLGSRVGLRAKLLPQARCNRGHCKWVSNFAIDSAKRTYCITRPKRYHSLDRRSDGSKHAQNARNYQTLPQVCRASNFLL